MPNYFITGTLGAGKSLCAVGRIRDYLKANRKVATNLDLYLDKMIGTKSKKCTVYRIPDKPVVADLYAIGRGNDSYDESKNGALILDECGTWFNSRTWGDKSRQDVINWFLHARKLGWDLYFLVQDIKVVDKQARLTLAEHVVYCRRTDRMKIPFIGWLLSLFSKRIAFMPKMHIGAVRYGDQPGAMLIDTWIYLGFDLYQAYDTKQVFVDHVPDERPGVYTVLPPYYSHGRYEKPWGFKKIMKMTRIYWKRFSRPVWFTLGLSLSAGVSAYLNYEPEILKDAAVKVEAVKNSLAEFESYKIVGYSQFPDTFSYDLVTGSGERISSVDLIKRGFKIKDRGFSEMLITKDGEYVSVYR